MFVVVTAFAVWLGWELKTVRERAAFRMEHAGSIVSLADTDEILKGTGVDYITHFRLSGPVSVTFWRRWLGDDAVVQIHTERPFEARRLFPEAGAIIFLDARLGKMHIRRWLANEDIPQSD
ncbi:MAG TPA: hypothetical protein VGJ26_16360 [Pirellulales bacterium]|jgi:hypothetical protein